MISITSLMYLADETCSFYGVGLLRYLLKALQAILANWKGKLVLCKQSSKIEAAGYQYARTWRG